MTANFDSRKGDLGDLRISFGVKAKDERPLGVHLEETAKVENGLRAKLPPRDRFDFSFVTATGAAPIAAATAPAPEAVPAPRQVTPAERAQEMIANASGAAKELLSNKAVIAPQGSHRADRNLINKDGTDASSIIRFAESVLGIDAAGDISKVASAVREYQERKKLQFKDGKIGRETLTAMLTDAGVTERPEVKTLVASAEQERAADLQTRAQQKAVSLLATLNRDLRELQADMESKELAFKIGDKSPLIKRFHELVNRIAALDPESALSKLPKVEGDIFTPATGEIVRWIRNDKKRPQDGRFNGGLIGAMLNDPAPAATQPAPVPTPEERVARAAPIVPTPGVPNFAAAKVG